MKNLRLYHYWRSSSSWRVRWAFAIKGIECEFAAVNLLDDSTLSPEHLARNPMGYVPVLEFPDEASGGENSGLRFLGESVAIIDWAERFRPDPSLFPNESLKRARAFQLAEIINSGTQPIQNPNVAALHSSDPEEQKRWMQHWIRHGLQAYERLVGTTAGRFSMGDELSLPDLFLIPQCYNALRQEISLADFPTIHRIYQAALETPSCQMAHPDRFKP